MVAGSQLIVSLNTDLMRRFGKTAQGKSDPESVKASGDFADELIHHLDFSTVVLFFFKE